MVMGKKMNKRINANTKSAIKLIINAGSVAFERFNILMPNWFSMPFEDGTNVEINSANLK